MHIIKEPYKVVHKLCVNQLVLTNHVDAISNLIWHYNINQDHEIAWVKSFNEGIFIYRDDSSWINSINSSLPFANDLFTALPVCSADDWQWNHNYYLSTLASYWKLNIQRKNKHEKKKYLYIIVIIYIMHGPTISIIDGISGRCCLRPFRWSLMPIPHASASRCNMTESN